MVQIVQLNCIGRDDVYVNDTLYLGQGLLKVLIHTACKSKGNKNV